MKEYQSLCHMKWDCKYHVVFIPKRRKYLGESAPSGASYFCPFEGDIMGGFPSYFGYCMNLN